MRRNRISHLLAAVLAAAALATVGAGPVSATATAGGSEPSSAYEQFRQGERDFMNRHDAVAPSSSR